ncbi:NUDIX domain-containing protein [Streptomyces omiyaensis]|uniref:NUDIX domain-containing protein n=1 Tax=Streptomyces omiyaensis TaxID=68247 RepID=A0ABW7BSS1_9ACTN|nr:NUDIX domain-containing protein [Streptomyces omiyaensis]
MTGRPRVSAYALAVREGRMLLTRLSEASPVFAPGVWHLPGGGVEPGEQPVEALAREVREETGLETAGAELLDARAYAVRRDGADRHLIALFYAVDLASTRTPVVSESGGSTDAVAWVPLPDLADVPLSPAVADALRLLEARGAARGPRADGP